MSGRVVGRRHAGVRRRRPGRARGVLLALLAVAAAATACTTVPRSSQPEIVQKLPARPGDARPAVAPVPGAQPRTIVESFLAANDLADPHHNAARAFLTAAARSRWSDATVTVVDNPTVGNVGPGNKVTVTGQEVGTVDADGVYTPSLTGDGNGTGGLPYSQTVTLARVAGQWRIDAVLSGLLVSTDVFEQYAQRPVYFFDSSGTHVVPEPRYTDLSGTADLVDWLVGQLVAPPSTSLQTALPSQTDPKRIVATVRPTGEVQIEIPGAAQLGSAGRNQLAAQIALTLAPIGSVVTMQITDGGHPVTIPLARSSLFTGAVAASSWTPPIGGSSLYYIRGGGVIAETGTPIPGRVGAGVYGLTSVALASPRGSAGTVSSLEIAGTRGPAGAQILDVGTADGLTATSVTGQLSRPAWDPDGSEVWIGDGTRLYRVSPTGQKHLVRVTAPSGSATGRVAAVRISPEGSRVSLVLTDPDGVGRLWVGTIVRGSGPVRVDGLTPISPQGVSVLDADWNDQLKLFAIGSDVRTGAPGVYEVQCDGSRWTLRGTAGLPQAADSITVAQDEVASVSAGSTVWKQQAGAWVPLLGTQTTNGVNPAYVE